MEGTYIFRLSYPENKFWQRLAVPSDHTLHGLCRVCLDALGFDNDHLYEFNWRDGFGDGHKADSPRSVDDVSAAEVTVGESGLPVDGQLDLLYDYGDSWRFNLKLERIEPQANDSSSIRLLESGGSPPRQYSRDEEWDDEEDWDDEEEWNDEEGEDGDSGGSRREGH